VSFNDYKAFAGRIILPIQGKDYTLPEVPAALGVKLTLLAERSAEILRIAAENEAAKTAALAEGKPAPEPTPLPDWELDDIDQTTDLTRALLGPLYDEMVADGVPYAALALAGQVATHDFLYGRDAAEALWNSGGDPKAVAESLSGDNIFSRNTGAANTTKRPASTSGTRPRRKK